MLYAYKPLNEEIKEMKRTVKKATGIPMCRLDIPSFSNSEIYWVDRVTDPFNVKGGCVNRNTGEEIFY